MVEGQNHDVERQGGDIDLESCDRTTNGGDGSSLGGGEEDGSSQRAAKMEHDEGRCDQDEIKEMVKQVKDDVMEMKKTTRISRNI